MKLTPYTKLLTMTKEAIDLGLAKVRAHSARKKAEYEVAKLEEKVADLERRITEKCSEKELNFDSIIDLQDELALAERRRDQFKVIIDELFPS